MNASESQAPASSNSESSPVCLITGGSSGIGLATAKHFASQGYRVAICGRDEAKLAAAKLAILNAFSTSPAHSEMSSDSSEHCLTVRADLNEINDAAKIAQTVMEKMTRIDVLVNNAAVAPLEEFSEVSAETFEATINVNLRSVFYLTQQVWRQMMRQGSGTIVNISSMAAIDPFSGFSLYGASKAWIELLTKALADEGQEYGIRVYGIRPGAVETPLLRSLFPDFPAQDCVQPEQIAVEIGDCVASPSSRVNGETYELVAG